MMKKSTIVTHTVDQGNLRVQIKMRENKPTMEEKDPRLKRIFSFKGQASLRVCYCKSKDAEETSIYNLPKLWG